MPFALRDSLTGRVQTIAPPPGRPLSLYVCGPTVYDETHVGHGRTYLYFDLIRRVLNARSVPVRHVMNITDVEDKIAARAAALQLTWKQLARREEKKFREALTALKILPPDFSPRASEYVAKMVEVARALEASGRVHRTEEGWMYTPAASHCPLNFPVAEDLARHAVPEPGHPFSADGSAPREFLVWKPQARPLPSVPSPWGPGVPGWHLECYTMAKDLLSIPVDLHGGGVDLVFPHHYAENEVALTLDGQPFSRNFFHTAFVTENGSKMSKSTGNLVPLRTALRRVGPDALRWYLLGPPYSMRLAWNDEELAASAEELAAIRATVRASIAKGAGGSVSARRYRTLATQILRDLEDGLRASDALDRIRAFHTGLAREAAPRVERGGGPEAHAALGDIEAMLGIQLY